MAKVKFNNDFEITVTNFNSSMHPNTNTGTINFSVTYDKRADVEANATEENMSIITVIRENDTALFEGFNKNITILDNVSDFQWIITVTAAKG